MKVFIDTNVIVDALTKREPFYEDSLSVIKSCDMGKNEGILAAHSLTNIYYLMRKDYTEDARRDVLMDLTEMFTIVGVEKEKIQAALKNKSFSDFEDGVQYECAIFSGVDVIVTRDVKHFENSQIKVMTPHDFMAETESDEQ